VKPVELMKYFITLLTRRGGHVLDCFAGSFTTGVAAQQLGCLFTGVELDAKYVRFGMRRLSA
jgi:DNA modification methylase